ncbi:MAG: TonB-dependent receptor [Rhodothalassiaceae bacterium]
MLSLACAGITIWASAETPIEVMQVTGRRLPDWQAQGAYPTTVFDAEALRAHPAIRLDDILRQEPSFSLFRRQTSLVANPTTQGVTLRGIGPNGAGRTLVLADGVPVNDPFGGWIYFSALNPDALGEVRVIRGGGAGGFGNQALTGTLQLTSLAPSDGFAVRALGGSFDTVDVSARAGRQVGRVSLGANGRYFRSDGFALLAEDQAGPVDIAAATEAATVDGEASVSLGADTLVTARVGWFEESRQNGIVLAENATDGIHGSLRLLHDPGPDEVQAEATAYYRRRDFSQTFTAVFDDARSQFRVVLDQFDVPAETAGALGRVRVPTGLVAVEVGADLRYVRGETNERFRNLGEGFTRRRRAGGEQLFAAGWLELAADPTPDLSLTAGVRGDYWQVTDGRREEFDLADGSQLLDLPIEDRRDGLVNGRLAALWQPVDSLTLRAAGYTGFRVPTLNEFFRPFRVGNDITEANAALQAERLYGIDAGLDVRPISTARLSLTYFRNWLVDAVGNVTIAQGPGVFPPAGFVPADGSLRQRRNVDEIVADGLEAAASLETAGWGVDLRYLFVAARITAFDQDPSLVGNRVAQSPRHRWTGSLFWRPIPKLRLAVYGQFTADQFEDDLNSRVLDGAATMDLAADYRISERVQLFVNATNVLGTRVETAVSGDGLVTLGPPRLISGGVRLAY